MMDMWLLRYTHTCKYGIFHLCDHFRAKLPTSVVASNMIIQYIDRINVLNCQCCLNQRYRHLFLFLFSSTAKTFSRLVQIWYLESRSVNLTPIRRLFPWSKWPHMISFLGCYIHVPCWSCMGCGNLGFNLILSHPPSLHGFVVDILVVWYEPWMESGLGKLGIPVHITIHHYGCEWSSHLIW